MRLKTLIEQLVQLQEKQNEDISGPEWRKNVSFGNLKMAAHSEWGEFIDEIKPCWCWWKDTGEIDTDKAVEEFCDVLMFMISIMTYDKNPNQWFGKQPTPASIDQWANQYSHSATIVTRQTIESISGCYENFFNNIEWKNQTAGLAGLILQVSHLLRVDYVDIFNAYERKIHKNRSRPNWGKNR